MNTITGRVGGVVRRPDVERQIIVAALTAVADQRRDVDRREMAGSCAARSGRGSSGVADAFPRLRRTRRGEAVRADRRRGIGNAEEAVDLRPSALNEAVDGRAFDQRLRRGRGGGYGGHARRVARSGGPCRAIALPIGIIDVRSLATQRSFRRAEAKSITFATARYHRKSNLRFVPIIRVRQLDKDWRQARTRPHTLDSLSNGMLTRSVPSGSASRSAHDCRATGCGAANHGSRPARK